MKDNWNENNEMAIEEKMLKLLACSFIESSSPAQSKLNSGLSQAELKLVQKHSKSGSSP